jgi:hypothetical protein
VRIKSALIVLLIAVASTGTVSVTGQEEPMPRVIPAAGFAPDVATVALVVEPLREVRQPTLAEAARNNDFVTFDALFREAKLRGEPVAAYETLHELWVYAISDRIGAFYGAETHDRLARAYPGYASFIDDLRVLDDRGNVYYPTSETRAFLLSRAIEGSAPRVMIASNRAENRQQPAESSERPVQTQTRRAARSRAERPPVVKTTEVASAPVTRAPAVKAPAITAPAVSKPIITEPIASSPVVSAPAVPAPVVATSQPVEPALAPVPVPSNTERVTSAAPETAVSTAPATEPAAPIARQNVFRSRGILLLVMGLVGVGLLAIMLRTPRESTPMSIMPPAAPPEKPIVPVEPLHRPDSARKTG